MARGLRELIADGSYQTIDLSRFGFERVAAGSPLRELNVVYRAAPVTQPRLADGGLDETVRMG